MDEVQLTQELVRINSENPPGNEKEIAKYIYDYLGDLKLPAELVKFEDNRYNVIMSQGKGNGLMLEDHMDTAPAGDSDNWKYDPFSAKIVGDKIYGLGTSDTKCGVAAILTAVKNAKGNFKNKLLIALVGDEEAGLGGSQYLIKNRREIFNGVGYGVIADSSQAIMIGQKGLVHARFIFKGKSAHGSRPQDGVNAIVKASEFISKLNMLQKTFDAKKDPLLGRGTINVGKIVGGTKVNVVPDKCEVDVDRRLTWGETPSSALKQLQRLSKAEVKLLSEPRSAIKSSADSKLVRMLKDIDNKLEIKTISGYTEMELYTRELGMKCVTCGAGEHSQAHNANEFVRVSSVRRITKTYTELIRRWCL